MKNSLFIKTDYDSIVERVNKLTPDTKPLWGKMNVAQMLSHCSEVQEVMNGKELKNTPFLIKLIGGYIKKMVLSPKPYQKSLKTHPQYFVKSQKEFDQEKQRLLTALEKMYSMSEQDIKNIKHPIFGFLTKEEKGFAAYRHNDHHLGQFGV